MVLNELVHNIMQAAMNNRWKTKRLCTHINLHSTFQFFCFPITIGHFSFENCEKVVVFFQNVLKCYEFSFHYIFICSSLESENYVKLMKL